MKSLYRGKWNLTKCLEKNNYPDSLFCRSFKQKTSRCLLVSQTLQSILMKLSELIRHKICKKITCHFYVVTSGPEILGILMFELVHDFSQKKNNIKDKTFKFLVMEDNRQPQCPLPIRTSVVIFRWHRGRKRNTLIFHFFLILNIFLSFLTFL